MTWSASFSGSGVDPTAEPALITALEAIAADPANGVTSASGSFETSGSINLLPPPPPPSTADLLDDVLADAHALDPADPNVAKLLEDLSALSDALTAQPAPEPSAPSEPPADATPPEHGATGDDGVPVAL